MAYQTISEIRQFNEDARQVLNELKGHRAASPTSTKQNTDRATLKQHLELAEDHVAKGKKLIARQREIVDELERDSHALAPNAGVLLAQFEDLQAAYIVDRDQLKELSELR